VLENRVPRKAFVPNRNQVTGSWRKLHNEELHDLYSPTSIIRIMKSKRMKLAGHVARTEELRNVYRLLVVKPEGNISLGRPRSSCRDSIKMDVTERLGWL
jgi:hypothetical protein